VVAIAIDCDNDALLYRVIPDGPACHTGRRRVLAKLSRSRSGGGAQRRALRRSDARAREHHRRPARKPPEGSYTAQLFAGGIDRIAKKIGEEATEVVIAAKNEDRGELIWETSDCSITRW